jgi:hypothetical protein
MGGNIKMADVYNFDYFRIGPTGMNDSAAGYSGERQFSVKMSNFGALNFRGTSGVLVRSNDYTLTSPATVAPTLKSVVPSDLDADKVDNPWVAGSSVKKIRDDQFVRMGMSMGGNTDGTVATTVVNAVISQPGADVMDTKAAEASGMASPKQYPTEGWHSFGGKYDKHVAYQG